MEPGFCFALSLREESEGEAATALTSVIKSARLIFVLWCALLPLCALSCVLLVKLAVPQRYPKSLFALCGVVHVGTKSCAPFFRGGLAGEASLRPPRRGLFRKGACLECPGVCFPLGR